MKEFPLDPQIRETWKKYPLRLSDGSKSTCCGLPTVLVQSMEGGFVTRNCPRCAKKDTLPEDVFISLDLRVACPECKQPMEPGRLPYTNYGYRCDRCDLGIKLADLLPRWTDL